MHVHARDAGSRSQFRSGSTGLKQVAERPLRKWVLQTLIEAGWVEVEQIASAGRTAQRFKAVGS